MMTPFSKDIYHSSREVNVSDARVARRPPLRVWWEITTPAERWSGVFVVFAIVMLIGILVGIAWYQHQQIARYRRGETVTAGGTRVASVAFVAPLDIDETGRLQLDDLDEVAPEEGAVEAPRDLSEVAPAAIVQAAIALRRAERAVGEQDWGAALEAYQRAAKIFPDSIFIRTGLGLCQLRERDYAGAADTFRWLAQQRPTWAGVWNNLGIAEAGRDRFEEAQLAFERAAMLDASYTLAARNLAVLAYRRGDMRQAAEALTAVLRRDPEDHEAALMCAVALLKTGRHGEAVARLEDLSVRWPSAPVWFHLAEARARLGQNSIALQALDRAVAMVDGRTAVAWLNRPEMDALREDPEFQRRWSQIMQGVP